MEKQKRTDAELLAKWAPIMGTALQASGAKLDSNEGIFFARELESIEQKFYEYKLRELFYRQVIPVSNRDNPGAEEITYYMFNKVGAARLLADYGDDLPRADVYGNMFKQPVKTLAISFGYSTQELRAARMAQRSLEEMKAVAARRAMHELENKLAFTGDSEFGIVGFFTNPNIPSGSSLHGAGGYEWSKKTALELIADITAGVNAVLTQSKGIHKPNTLLVPLANLTILGATPVPNTNVTVLNYIMDNEKIFGIKDIIGLPVELDTVGYGTTPMAVYYEKDPENMEIRIPLEMTMLPIQYRDLEFVVPIEARNGGVVVRYPLSTYFQYHI
jgi:hypothetical protein